MAVRLLANVVADLCLGKPPLRSISAAATVADAIAALKSSEENFVSVWSCDHSLKRNLECVCVGKVCMVDVILYLCREENLPSPASALKAPVSVLLSKTNGRVIHVDPSTSLLDAIDLIVEGAQNLVVPIKSTTAALSKRKQIQKSITTVHKGQEFCWLTQEDVIRFLLCSIGLFSPLPSMSIDILGIITTEFLAVEYHLPALAAAEAISRSLVDQTSVAVVDGEGTLIGEISPFTLASCDETLAPAIVALSAGDLMAYIDCGGPSEEILRVVEARLREKKLDNMINEFMILCPYNGDHSSSSSSSEDELSSPTTTLSKQYSRSNSRSARTAEAIVCHPRSSLVAVMIQAISHRVNSVWVVEHDCSVVGIVTFANMLAVFRENLESMI